MFKNYFIRISNNAYQDQVRHHAALARLFRQTHNGATRVMDIVCSDGATTGRIFGQLEYCRLFGMDILKECANKSIN